MNKIKKFIFLTIVGTLLFSCATSANQLKSAQASFESGEYKSAIEFGLKSYELAMKKNKKPEETAMAKQFLENNFPVAIEKLVESAKQAEGGSNNEKAHAWEKWDAIVKLNQLIDASIASSFLQTSDFTKELQNAKELAAAIYYEEGDKAFNVGDKKFFKQAYEMYSYALMVVPGYKDAAKKMDLAKTKATTTYAIIIEDIKYESKLYTEAFGDENFYFDIKESAQNYLKSLDKPEFTNIIQSYSEKDAKSGGADIAVLINLNISLQSSLINDPNNYWMTRRSYNAKGSIKAVNLNTGVRAEDAISSALNQKIVIDLKDTGAYSKKPMPQDLYYNLNSNEWNYNMKNLAIENFRNNKTANFTFWGTYEAGYPQFYDTANVADLGVVEINGENMNALDSLFSELEINSEWYAFRDLGKQIKLLGSVFDYITTDLTNKMFNANNDTINVIKSEL